MRELGGVHARCRRVAGDLRRSAGRSVCDVDHAGRAAPERAPRNGSSPGRPMAACRRWHVAQHHPGLEPPATAFWSTPYCTPARGSSTCTTAGQPVDEHEQHGGGEPLQPQQPAAAARSRRRAVVDVLVGDLRAHRAGCRCRRRARAAPGQPDTIRERSRKPVTGPAVAARHGRPGLPAGQPDQPLGLVDLVADHRVERLERRPVGGRHGADAQRALHQRVGPAAVEVEEPDRLRRQQRGVGHQVAERHRLQQPQPGQPEPQVAGHPPRPGVRGVGDLRPARPARRRRRAASGRAASERSAAEVSSSQLIAAALPQPAHRARPVASASAAGHRLQRVRSAARRPAGVASRAPVATGAPPEPVGQPVGALAAELGSAAPAATSRASRPGEDRRLVDGEAGVGQRPRRGPASAGSRERRTSRPRTNRRRRRRPAPRTVLGRRRPGQPVGGPVPVDQRVAAQANRSPQTPPGRSAPMVARRRRRCVAAANALPAATGSARPPRSAGCSASSRPISNAAAYARSSRPSGLTRRSWSAWCASG